MSIWTALGNLWAHGRARPPDTYYNRGVRFGYHLVRDHGGSDEMLAKELAKVNADALEQFGNSEIAQIVAARPVAAWVEGYRRGKAAAIAGTEPPWLWDA